MKKVLLLPIIAILFSCTNKRIDFVKNDLKSKDLQMSDKDISNFKFDETELSGKDAYELTYKRMSKDFELYLPTLDTLVASKNLIKYKDKSFHKINAYRIVDKDTLNHSIYYLNDRDKIYSNFYIK
ncbi:hypothetical protein [Halpernia sp. GG3]